MIKFVCSSCGERLSVPDAQGGRKGVCPTCQAINRIPLKGYNETLPKGQRPVKGALSVPALSGRVDEPELPPAESTPPSADQTAPWADPNDLAQERPPARDSAAGALTGGSAPAPIQESAGEGTGGTQDRKRRLVSHGHSDATPLSPGFVILRKERRLPKKVKMALLILAALAIITALYCGLLFALHMVVPGS